jgi:tRNA-specific 2-thiouridylase
MNIAVGISGGVDSAVAALLCREQGHDVTGVFMSIWKEGVDDANVGAGGGNACFGPDEKHDLEDARRVCEHIGIPLEVVDCSEAFHREILSYFRESYLNGWTPNPCVYCNQQLKFGLLPTILQERNIPVSLFATGHYARVGRDASGGVHLKRAVDLSKDQSYFLYRLTREQLERSLFPLGEMIKEQVREKGRQAGLHVWDKEESQDFYSGDYRTLVRPCCGEGDAGRIVTREGEILGRHEGIWNYTIGQRRGLGLSAPNPLYVVEIRSDRNEVVVGEREELFRSHLRISGFRQLEDLPLRAACKIRSASQAYPCSILREGDVDSVSVEFDEPVSGVSPGQSAVLYTDDLVLGGGVIDNRNEEGA